jgi:hypothetical protein
MTHLIKEGKKGQKWGGKNVLSVISFIAER